MCYHLTILAHSSAYRAVAQCEHGALHVSWDIATVRLRPQDFLTLAQFLDRWGRPGHTSSAAEGWCQLTRDGRGSTRLWIGQVGLALAANEVAAFIGLVQQAAALLRMAGDQSAATQQEILRCPVL